MCRACAQMYAYSSWIANFYSVTSCVVLLFPAGAVTYLYCSFVSYERHAFTKRDDRHLTAISVIQTAE